MPYTVAGSLEGTAYKVTVADDGTATGSQPILDALVSWQGQTVTASPTGPEYTVTDGDPVAVYAALTARTQVTATSGDTPPLVPPVRLGAVY